MNQDTNQGHPEGATPASGFDCPPVVDSLGSCSFRTIVRHNLKPSSNAHLNPGLSPTTPSLQLCTLPSRAIIRVRTDPDTSAAVPHPDTAALHRDALVPAHPRTALSVPRAIHSVSYEPSNTAPGIQPTGLPGPSASPVMPPAFAIRPPIHALASPMDILIDARVAATMARRARIRGAHPPPPSRQPVRASPVRGTPQGHQEGATTASGFARPMAVDSPGNHSPRTSAGHPSQPSRNAFHRDTLVPPHPRAALSATRATHSVPPEPANTAQGIKLPGWFGPATLDSPAQAAQASATTTMHRATADLTPPRAALSAPGTTHSVSCEPSHPVPDNQSHGWQAPAPTGLPSAAANWPSPSASATPMEISIDAWPVPEPRAILAAQLEPQAQGHPPSSPQAPPVAPHPAGSAVRALRSPHPPAHTSRARARPHWGPHSPQAAGPGPTMPAVHLSPAYRAGPGATPPGRSDPTPLGSPHLSTRLPSDPSPAHPDTAPVGRRTARPRSARKQPHPKRISPTALRRPATPPDPLWGPPTGLAAHPPPPLPTRRGQAMPPCPPPPWGPADPHWSEAWAPWVPRRWPPSHSRTPWFPQPHTAAIGRGHASPGPSRSRPRGLTRTRLPGPVGSNLGSAYRTSPTRVGAFLRSDRLRQARSSLTIAAPCGRRHG